MSEQGGPIRDPMIGRAVLGRYRIVRALAKGGMGVVYLARSEGASGFTKPVVVKRMASDLMVDDSMSRMFVREARLMSRLIHPGLVQVIDFGEARGDYLMIIEYVHGYHLGQWYRFVKQARGPFRPALLLHIMAKVLDALHYAHTLKDSDGRDLRVVHRDVSPSNILIDVDGHVKLADFGVARSRDQTEQTDQSTIKGKMPYLAPELFRLEQPSAGTDAYACAVVLHELLVGRNEFRGEDVATTVSRVLEHVPTPVDAVRDDVPDGLGDILSRALSKDADARYQTAAELAKAFRSVRGMAEEEADAAIRELARGDFTDPEFSKAVRFLSLSDREEVLQNPPEQPLPSEPPGAVLLRPSLSSSPPTMAAKISIEGRGDAAPRRAMWIGLAALALAIAGGGVALAVMGGNPGGAGPEERTFVVVQAAGRETRDGGEGPRGGDEVARPDPDAGLARDSGRPTETPPTRTPPEAGGRPSTRSLTGAFQRRRGEVVACFRQHAGADAPDSIEVGFVVATDGSVDSATVAPASTSGTPLGQCVLGVARGTRFPPQGRPVRFRIPVRVRVGG